MSRLVRRQQGRVRSSQQESEAVPTRVLRKDAASSEKIQTHSVRWNKEQWPGGPKVRQGDLSPGVVELIEEKAGGFGLPATITVETFGQEIPSGEWTALDWVAATRNNLMSFAGTEIRRPVGGTWHAHDVAVEWQGVGFESDWKGQGARARLTADGEVVWPQGLEVNTSPDRGLPVPVWSKESIPTMPLPAGLTTLEVRQESGEPQTVQRAYMSLSIREPRSAEQAPLVTGRPFALNGWIAIAHDGGNGATLVREPGDDVGPNISGGGRGVAWSSDGKRVVFVHGTTGDYTVVDVESGTVESGWPAAPTAGVFDTVAVCFSPDTRKLFLCRRSNDSPTIVEIDVATKTLAPAWPGENPAEFRNPFTVAVNPAGSLLAIGHQTIATQFFTVASTEVRAALSGWPGMPGQCRGVAFSPDGALIACHVQAAGRYRVVDVATQEIDTAWDYSGSSPTDDVGGAVAWSPDGASLAVGSSSGVTLWDRSSKETLWEASSIGAGKIRHVAFSPEGSTLAVVGESSPYVKFLNAEDGSEASGWTITLPGTGRDVVFAWDPNNSTAG